MARRKFSRSVLSTMIAAAAALTALLAPAGASAGPLVASAECDGQQLSRPFAPWLDPAQYTLNEGGDFEAGAPGWSLSGDAAVVAGNESYFVTSASDSSSLRLPPESSATSSTICVGIEHPTIRLFAKRAGAFPASAAVEVRFEDARGEVRSAPIGTVAGTASWQPTTQMPIVANLLPLLPGDYTPVQFRLTGLTGTTQVDDFYVDPWGKR